MSSSLFPFNFIRQFTKHCAQNVIATLLISLAYPHYIAAQQEVSVNQFTGTATVSLPLGSVAMQGVTLGVSLQYAATGMNADDRGGVAGVGWSFGGVPTISREVRGLPDDYSNASSGTAYPAHYGWLMPATQTRVQSLSPSSPAFTYPLTVSSSCSTGEEPQAAAVVATFESTPNTAETSNQYDSEPDIFSYGVPGHAGRFVFDQFGNARTMPFDPITITYDASLNDSLGRCIHSFTIRTPEGNTYVFGAPDIIHKKSLEKTPSNVTVRPSIFQRDFYYYRLPPNQEVIYSAAWHISSIQNVAGERISFAYYKRGFYDMKLYYEPSAVLLTNDPGNPEYRWVIKRNNLALREISGPTTFLRFLRTDSTTYFSPGALAVETLLLGYHTPQGNRVTKTVSLKYDIVYPVNNMSSDMWFGVPQSPNSSPNQPWLGVNYGRRFLREVSTAAACGPPLTYTFRYRAVQPGTVGQSANYIPAIFSTIPPPGGFFRDYWQYLCFDTDQGWDSQAGDGPAVYTYSGLSPQSVPAAPYRLYPYPQLSPAPQRQGGLDDQRPSGSDVTSNSDLILATAPTPAGATSFERSTLLGVLETIRLPTGGKISLEYEPHQFHDPVLESLRANSPNCTGPGARVRAINWTEPGTGVTQRREYRYTTSDGTTSSGRLLWQPCFGFTRPFSTAQVFTINNLANHSFENRDIGYGRVTEIVAGRGQTVTTFALDGAAEDITADPDGSAGSAPGSHLPVWNRSVVGPARLAAGCSSCPSCASFATAYVPGYETYPFAPSTNYDFWRGTVLSVTDLAEPVGTAAPVTVRSTTYAYTFRNLAPTVAPVVAWAYDGVSNPPVAATSPRAFVVARYQLLTDFQLALSQETTTLYDQQAPTAGVSTTIRYAYNARGQLAGVARTNSDGGVVRTRYKYISDYGLPANPSTSDANLQALAYRFYTERLTADLVETITDVVPAGTTGARLTGVTQTTFRLVGTTVQRTRPHQTLRWQTASPPAAAQNPADTTMVVGTTWRLSSRFRAENTIEEVQGGARQVPVTISTRTGNKVSSLHLGYGSMLPVLQLANAYASEARFSNFEETSTSDLVYAWQLSATGNSRTGSAARTGTGGLHITAPTTLTTVLPAPAAGAQLPPPAPGIRVSFWVRAATASQLTVQLVQTTTQPATVAFTKSVTAPAGTGNGPAAWRWMEVIIPDLASRGVTPTNHGDFTVSIANTTAGQVLDLDDVLLLPSTATASSTTYEPMWGKTSETNEQGRTTYYDYSPAGRLRAVRDHQGNLVQRVEQVINSRSADESTISFTVTSDNPASSEDGDYHEDDVLTFTPRGICDETASLQWNFGCTGAGCTSTANVPTFRYPVTYTGSSTVYYTVTLTVTTPYGTKVITRQLNVKHPVPHLGFTTCVDGSRILSGCNNNAPPLTCGTGAGNGTNTSNGNFTTLRVVLTGTIIPTAYRWEIRLPNSVHPTQWVSGTTASVYFNRYVIGSSSNRTVDVPHLNETVEYRCVMSCSDANQSWTETATSGDFLIEFQNANGGDCY